MSRSYKKVPVAALPKDKFFKNYFNRRVRRNDETLNNSSYKKLSQSYDICDYRGDSMSFTDFWEREVRHWYEWEQELGKPFPNKKVAYRQWLKIYKTK